MCAKQYDEFSIRMKEYEHETRVFLDHTKPVMIRIDGKAFHTYTKGFQKPFDERISTAMWETAIYLCKTVTGAKIAYTQSDEITLFLNSYENEVSEPYYNNNKSKLESVIASKATKRFNQVMMERLLKDMEKEGLSSAEIATTFLTKKAWAEFDARAFSLPKEEVISNFVWRQKDAIKNSVSMVAQANFSPKLLNGLNGLQLKERLEKEKNIIWDELPIWQQRGVAIVKTKEPKTVVYQGETIQVLRNVWKVDEQTPIFAKEREYIEQYV